MTLRVEVVPDATAAARMVGELIATRARESTDFSLALSKAHPALLEELADASLVVYQVDERVAPAGDPERNLNAIVAAISAERVRPMPVEDPDLESAARRYAEQLPPRVGLVHLGLGADGHTASLVPGDPVLDVDDALVAVTAEYEGRRRMTLTYPALAAAHEIVWLVTGAEKQDALARLLAGDSSIPAGRVENPRQLVITDAAAAPVQPSS